VSVLASKLDDTAAAFHPFAITVAGVQSFGRRHRPRVIWAGVTNPPDTLLNLQSAVAQIAQSCEIHLDDRTYKPHLTLGRVRASNNLEALTAAMASAEDAVFGESSVQRVLIMQSRLLSHGAEYTMLHESALKGER
jgi:2'-5' RNA ligase